MTDRALHLNERPVFFMKRFGFVILCALLCLAASAALAGDVGFESIGAACTIPDSYVILTADNLPRHATWIQAHHTTEEEILAEWNARGVLLQAWTMSGDACLEITAVRDQDAMSYHDIDNQTPALRAAYRQEHLKGAKYTDQGYKIESAEWKKTAQGRFLMLKYKRTANGESWRGYARKTVKNGYTIMLDYKVYDRKLKAGDNTALNNVWKTWRFTASITPAELQKAGIGTASGAVTGADEGENEPAPFPSTANLKFTDVPPDETNTGKFTVAGTCDPNTHLMGVLMRMDGQEPVIFETDASSRGKFKMPVQLPQEGVWLMTVIAQQGGRDVEEKVFSTTTYQANLLVVNLDSELPLEMQIEGDFLVISGKTVKQTTVQCLVDGRYDKQVRTNNSGKFSFKLDTSMPGSYNITVVFSKKNYATRRFTCKATRAVSDEETRKRALDTAIKPAYSILADKAKAEKYLGKVMTYNMYVVSVEHVGSQWLVFMAQRMSDDAYADLVVVTAEEEPDFETGSQHRMYGTLAGTYLVQDSLNGDRYYPCFDLVFWGDQV